MGSNTGSMTIQRQPHRQPSKGYALLFCSGSFSTYHDVVSLANVRRDNRTGKYNCKKDKKSFENILFSTFPDFITFFRH